LFNQAISSSNEEDEEREFFQQRYQEKHEREVQDEWNDLDQNLINYELKEDQTCVKDVKTENGKLYLISKLSASLDDAIKLNQSAPKSLEVPTDGALFLALKALRPDVDPSTVVQTIK
jgi:hypothetical protein